MPESPEIYNLTKNVLSKYIGKKLTNIKINYGRYKKHEPFAKYKIIKNELPLKLLDVKTKGKLLYMIFDKGYYILSTLGLSGGWCYLENGTDKFNFSKIIDDYGITDYTTSPYLKAALNHLNVAFITKEGILYYYDVLSFGTLKVVDEDELNKKLKKIGPDVMEEDTTLEVFKNQIRKHLDKPIGIVLMDQKVISGIGNYLRADILYLSKINPFRKVNKLSDNDIKVIFNNSKILTWGDYDIKKGKALKIIKKTTKLPKDYDRIFFIYSEDEDIHGNKVVKKELIKKYIGI
jgi:formamidopyrimidine-DNA glycosylase